MKPVPILVSRHFLNRCQERFGFDKEKAKEIASEAYVLGSELPNELKEFYIYKTSDNPPDTQMYIYEDKCIVYGLGDTLPKAVTIYPIKN